MGCPGCRFDWKKVTWCPDIACPGCKTTMFVVGCYCHAHEGRKGAALAGFSAGVRWETGVAGESACELEDFE